MGDDWFGQSGRACIGGGSFRGDGRDGHWASPSRPTGKSRQKRLDQHPDTGRTFRRAWKGGENKLVGSVSRANTGNLPQPRADRPEPRRFDCRWLYRGRSEEHTSELQSRRDLVCRLLLEKKKKKIQYL